LRERERESVFFGQCYGTTLALLTMIACIFIYISRNNLKCFIELNMEGMSNANTSFMLGLLRPQAIPTGLEHPHTHKQEFWRQGGSTARIQALERMHVRPTLPSWGIPQLLQLGMAPVKRSFVLVLFMVLQGTIAGKKSAQAAFGAGPKFPEQFVHQTIYHSGTILIFILSHVPAKVGSHRPNTSHT